MGGHWTPSVQWSELNGAWPNWALVGSQSWIHDYMEIDCNTTNNQQMAAESWSFQDSEWPLTYLVLFTYEHMGFSITFYFIFLATKNLNTPKHIICISYTIYVHGFKIYRFIFHYIQSAHFIHCKHILKIFQQ